MIESPAFFRVQGVSKDCFEPTEPFDTRLVRSSPAATQGTERVRLVRSSPAGVQGTELPVFFRVLSSPATKKLLVFSRVLSSPATKEQGVSKDQPSPQEDLSTHSGSMEHQPFG